jgi:SPP1 gp7 family putative phage head morphogenesis protein
MANSDLGHKLTDAELAKLERRIAKLYREAGEELQATIDAYFEQFKKRDEEMKAMIGTVQNGKEWTEADYKQWRLNQIGRGKRYQAMRDKVAHRVTDANAVAVSYTNDATPGIYSLNRNYSAYTIEQVAGNVGFDLWDEQTVKRLAVEQPDLMPYYPPKRALKRGIDLAYGKKQITASVTSSILQGKSIKHMADDLQKRITTMSRDSAIRTARTAVTGAQNAGRMDSYATAEKMGIKLKKEWLATLDSRTRHSHAMLDGEQVAQDKKFSNGCRFPGDPQGPPWEIYNCRCTLIAAVEGVDTSSAQRRAKNADTGQTEVISNMSYAEWAGWKKEEAKKPEFTTSTQKYEFYSRTINKTLESVESEKTGLDYEVGTVVDLEGNVIKSFDGKENSVEVPTELLKGNIFTHNHPNGSCFSVEDLKSFASSGLFELRASVGSGKFYSLRLTETKADLEKLTSDYRASASIRKATEEIKADFKSGKITKEKAQDFNTILEYQSNLGDKFLQENAKDYGCIYVREV